MPRGIKGQALAPFSRLVRGFFACYWRVIGGFFAYFACHTVCMSKNNTHNAAPQTLIQALSATLIESLWPKRCIICGEEGSVLCECCERHLDFLDRWSACPRCGSAFGLRWCTECNSYTLRKRNLSELPFDAAASALRFSASSGALIRGYKDKGEQALSDYIARFMHQCMHPEWTIDAFTYIPASAQALKRRGFDHMHQIGTALERASSIPLVPLFERPKHADQRTLSQTERSLNAARAFTLQQHCALPRSVCILDDVITTGATACAAAQCLKQAGVGTVYVLTCARV